MASCIVHQFIKAIFIKNGNTVLGITMNPLSRVAVPPRTIHLVAKFARLNLPQITCRPFLLQVDRCKTDLIF